MLRLRRYERISVKNRRIRSSRGPVYPKFQVEGVAPTNHSSYPKTRLNDLSCGIKIWTDLPFCHNSRLTFDRRTILIARPRLHSMQRGKNTFKEVFGHTYIVHCIIMQKSPLLILLSLNNLTSPRPSAGASFLNATEVESPPDPGFDSYIVHGPLRPLAGFQGVREQHDKKNKKMTCYELLILLLICCIIQK